MLYIYKLKAGGRHDMPPPLYASRCGPTPAHTRLTPGLRRRGAQCALLPVAESALNILYVHDICQTDVRQHYCLMPPPRGQGHNNRVVRCAAELLRISYFQKGSRLSSWIFLFSQFLWKTEISPSCKNLVKIGRCTAKLLRMFTFQNGGRPPSWIGMTS